MFKVGSEWKQKDMANTCLKILKRRRMKAMWMLCMINMRILCNELLNRI